jgi:DNA repair exonuclease SbcCD ATPase subunit
MTPNDKRIIIDKLFAMDIINKMNQLVRADARDVKFNMDVFDRDILTIKNNIDIAVKELQKLQIKLNEDNSAKILELAKRLEEYKPKLQEGYDKKKEWETKKADILKSQTVFVRQKAKISQELQHFRNQMNLYNQDKCPTCATPFNEARFDLIKGQLQESISQKSQELESIKQDEQKYNTTLDSINQGLAKIDNFIIQIQTTYKLIEAELAKLKMNKSAEFESIQNIISENKESLIKKSDDKLKYDEEYKYLSVLEQLYSDAGVKKKILESYLPTLNKEIEYTLNELHFPYRLTFNSDFEPDMEHLGIDIGVDTLSTGEKKRVDLAVLISIIRMLKHKYPGLNIFMLDEVLSSIDGDGIYDIIGLLQKISKEMAMNIFVINHSPLPIEQFDYRIEINKNAGFSDLTIEKLNEGE